MFSADSKRHEYGFIIIHGRASGVTIRQRLYTICGRLYTVIQGVVVAAPGRGQGWALLLAALAGELAGNELHQTIVSAVESSMLAGVRLNCSKTSKAASRVGARSI